MSASERCGRSPVTVSLDELRGGIFSSPLLFATLVIGFWFSMSISLFREYNRYPFLCSSRRSLRSVFAGNHRGQGSPSGIC